MSQDFYSPGFYYILKSIAVSMMITYKYAFYIYYKALILLVGVIKK